MIKFFLQHIYINSSILNNVLKNFLAYLERNWTKLFCTQIKKKFRVSRGNTGLVGSLEPDIFFYFAKYHCQHSSVEINKRQILKKKHKLR